MRDGVTTRTVVAEVSRPTVEAKRPTAPDTTAVKALVTSAKETRLDALVVMLATTKRGAGSCSGWAGTTLRRPTSARS